MPFESKPRVKFIKNPLVEVVCQFSFISSLENLDDEKCLIQLHDSIKEKLPLFKRAKSVSLNVDTDNQTVSQIENSIYEFSSLDETVRVEVDPSNITIVTSNYESKERFFEYVFYVYDTLERLGLTNPIKRVGLRYKDIIQRSNLDLEKANEIKWSELLREPLVSVLEYQDLSPSILSSQSSMLLKLSDMHKNSKMNAKYGLVKNSKSGEQCFMIDSDFYTEGVLKYDDAREFLYRANIKARDFFQWCIKPKLFDALQPEQFNE